MSLRPVLPLLAAALLCACQPEPPVIASAAAASAPDLLARGEYLVRIGGCNDCHTPGYADKQGELPQAQWLTGSPLGQRGPWGTTYPTNLRLRMQELSEQQWMEYSANLRTRPLMPDFAVRAMQAEDRRAIYRFIRSLGPAGQPAPAALPPGQQPPPPYLDLVLPPASAATSSAQPSK